MKRVIAGVAAAGIALTGVVAASSASAATQPTKKYTAAQVAKHKSSSDCWSIVGSGVYNLTSYIPKHPGGKSQIISICGKNGTSAFNSQHMGSKKVAKLLAGYKIGTFK